MDINLFLYLELKNKKHYLCNRKRGKRLLRIKYRLDYLSGATWEVVLKAIIDILDKNKRENNVEQIK